jgi:hypothetical protein
MLFCMEEIEVPLEQVQENAHHAHGEKGWLSWAALSSAVIAVCAAVAALFAGQHANEAMFDQIKAANDWNYYQAKGVKSAVLNSKIDLLKELGKQASPADVEKIESYKHDQEQITEHAKEHEAASEHHLKIHELAARAVTLFQVSIALGAVAILSRKRKFLFASFAISIVGIFFFVSALLL